MMTDFGKVGTPAELLAAAREQAQRWPMKSIEFNVPATLLMALDVARATKTPLNPSTVETEAEQGMLQIALLNEGCDPGSPFINAAHREGWRYRPHIGFYHVRKIGG